MFIHSIFQLNKKEWWHKNLLRDNLKHFISLTSIRHPWRASKHCDLQLSPWPHSMIFQHFLFHPLLSFATFSSAYLFFYIPENSNLMRFSLLFLLLYVMYVSNPIPFSNFKVQNVKIYVHHVKHTQMLQVTLMWYIFIFFFWTIRYHSVITYTSITNEMYHTYCWKFL